MKKILFIIQSYPSNRSANVVCDEKIMKALQATGGYEIHCLAYRFHGQKLDENINGFKIHRYHRGKWWNLYTYARDNEVKPFYRLIVKLNRLYMRIRQLVCIPIYPNYEPLLARTVAKNAVDLHNSEKFDIIIAEHSGRDTLYAGMKVKERDPNVKLIAILWDPLSGRNLAKYLPKSYAEHKVVNDEIHLLHNSDCIICLKSNRKYQEENSVNKPFFPKVKFLDIPGIIAPASCNTTEPYTKHGLINILYSGILNLPDRDPSKLIKVLKMSRFSDRINIMFFSIGNDGISKAKNELQNFNGKWLIHPYIPKETLNVVAENSDVLVNIGGPNAGMVPSKIFEYMSLGKPIVSTFYIDDDSSISYFTKYPLAHCMDIRKDANELVDEFDHFVECSIGKKVPFNSVREAFPLNTPEEFVKVIGDVTTG